MSSALRNIHPNLTMESYLKDPCGVSSLPYWKASTLALPPNLQIIHQNDFNPSHFAQCIDEPYFRLLHRLENLHQPQIPEGFHLLSATAEDFVKHINRCYINISITEEALRQNINTKVYVPELWIAIADDETGQIAATGIGQLDPQLHEGILDWIQVSPQYRRTGLGTYLVQELLWRMKDLASFATVSGRIHEPSCPENLYRHCGFIGNDIWHILTKM